MGTVYAPVSSAAKQTRDYVMPGKYTVGFLVSEKGVKVDEHGYEISPMVKVEGQFGGFYDRFRIPQDQEQEAALQHRVSPRTGKEYVDQSYKKWCMLQKVLGVSFEDHMDILDVLNETKVEWGVQLEFVISSKEVSADWDDVVEWCQENLKKPNGTPAYTESEYDGAQQIRWRVNKVDDSTQELIDHIEGFGGVKANNSLDGFRKPVKV